MYFAVVKLTFESDASYAADPHDLRALAERIRKRFKVCVAVVPSESGVVSLAVTALGSTEEHLSRTLDKISAFCEEQGIGRIESEDALLDHIDHIADFHADHPGDERGG